jgi:hypothetical protein
LPHRETRLCRKNHIGDLNQIIRRGLPER